VSLLDWVLVRMSAARIGSAGRPAEAVMREVVEDLFPCSGPTRTAAKPLN
jgi:hypothetical protein